MKKVNFNALQNFEVPESWIENAINAKPKKKPFYLNPRYYGTAAALVIAVGIAAFSLLYLNRDFTPPTGQNVEGTSVSSTFTYPKDAELLTQNEINTTFLAETTKSTEKPKATGVTEQNEEIYEQEINSEEQDNESSESEGNAPAQSEASEQREQPGRNENSNNRKKPEQTNSLRDSTNPVEKPNDTEPIQEKDENSGEEHENSERVEDNTVSTEVADPTASIKTINTKWGIIEKYTINAGASGYEKIDGEEKPVLCGDLFTNTIDIIFPNEIRNDGFIKVIYTINGIDKYTNNVNGTLTYNFRDTIKTYIDSGKIKDGIISVDLSYMSINIPCGEYKIELKCEKANYENTIFVSLNNDSDSVKLDFG